MGGISGYGQNNFNNYKYNKGNEQKFEKGKADKLENSEIAENTQIGNPANAPACASSASGGNYQVNYSTYREYEKLCRKCYVTKTELPADDNRRKQINAWAEQFNANAPFFERSCDKLDELKAEVEQQKRYVQTLQSCLAGSGDLALSTLENAQKKLNQLENQLKQHESEWKELLGRQEQLYNQLEPYCTFSPTHFRLY